MVKPRSAHWRQACVASPLFVFPHFSAPYRRPLWPPTMASSSSCPRRLPPTRARFRPCSSADARTIRRRLHRSTADRRARRSRRWPPQMRASPHRMRKPSPTRNFAGRKSITQDQKRQEPLSSTRPRGSCSWSSRTERRCATASALGDPASNGRASSGSAASPNGRIGRRRPRCCCAVPICRAIWRAGPTIRSAQGRSISGPRSTAFTAPTSRRPSAITSRQAVSG